VVEVGVVEFHAGAFLIEVRLDRVMAAKCLAGALWRY